VAYYDSNTRQLFVLEIWEDSTEGFPLIDLGMLFTSILWYCLYLLKPKFQVTYHVYYLLIRKNCFGSKVFNISTVK
jgi:hypothetical protein